jgi:hypothetical protein
MSEKPDISINNNVDVDLYLRLEEVGEIYFINIPLYYYRLGNTNSVAPQIKRGEYKYQGAKVMLNGFARRMSSGSFLFTAKKDLYYRSQRYWLKLYLNSYPFFTKECFRYVNQYLKFRNYSFHSFWEILKGILYRSE